MLMLIFAMRARSKSTSALKLLEGVAHNQLLGIRAYATMVPYALSMLQGGNFKQHLSNIRDNIRIQDCFRWAKQAAQSLVFCHSNSILHRDICYNNFFLDQNLNLKLGDFAGSSIDQLLALVCYYTTH
jgi:serine/threonine protein kinase